MKTAPKNVAQRRPAADYARELIERYGISRAANIATQRYNAAGTDETEDYYTRVMEEIERLEKVRQRRW